MTTEGYELTDDEIGWLIEQFQKMGGAFELDMKHTRALFNYSGPNKGMKFITGANQFLQQEGVRFFTLHSPVNKRNVQFRQRTELPVLPASIWDLVIGFSYVAGSVILYRQEIIGATSRVVADTVPKVDEIAFGERVYIESVSISE